MTISYAQAHKSKNERVKIFDLAQFLIFFLILLILEEEEMWLCLCRWRLVYFRIREDRGEVNLLFEPRGVGMTLTLGGGRIGNMTDSRLKWLHIRLNTFSFLSCILCLNEQT